MTKMPLIFRLLPVLAGLALTSGAAIANDFYIAQTAAGSNNGQGCANAFAVSFFNTASNWGTGANQIGPGTTVHLCGTNTAAAGTTFLAFRGSGSAISPITLLFEPGAVLQAPYLAASSNGTGCGGGISMCGLSYITVDGGSNGVIQNTANGSALANRQLSTAIDAYNCTNCTVKNLHITNIYVHSGTENVIDETQERAVAFTGKHWTVSGNVIHDCGWCLFSAYWDGDTDINILNNDISNMGHGIMFATSGANSATNLTISGNQFHDSTAWDTPGCGYHQDGMHFFGVPGSSMSGIYVSNNYFYGNWGTCPTGWIFVEASGAGTPANMSNSYWWNNVGIVSSASPIVNTNGWFNVSSGVSGVTQIVNNTIIGPNATDNTLCFSLQDLTNLTFENNTVHSCGDPVRITNSTVVAADYNYYGSSCSNGNNCFIWNGSFSGSFTAWKTNCSCDAHSVQNSNPLLNPDGSPQSGSPVASFAGKNLMSMATGSATSLSNDTNKGNTRSTMVRPLTAAWVPGAYAVGQQTSSPPTPASGLTVTIR